MLENGPIGPPPPPSSKAGVYSSEVGVSWSETTAYRDRVKALAGEAALQAEPGAGAGNVLIIANGALNTLDGFNALPASRGDFILQANPNLTRLHGFSSLASVGHAVVIEGNPSLSNIDGLLALSSIGHEIAIRGNPALANLDGLSNLASVGHAVVIEGNPSLINIDGLHLIDALNGPLFITGNERLEHVDGLSSLRHIGETLLIIGNPALSQVDGLWLLSHVEHDLRVFENPSLTECGWGLLAVLQVGYIGGEIEIRDNGPGCNSVEDIILTVEQPQAAADILAARINRAAEVKLIRRPDARALTSKLESAIAQIVRSNYAAALDDLVALVTQVETLRDDGYLGPEDADWILAMAGSIIEALSSML
jgi:hypothetical protein